MSIPVYRRDEESEPETKPRTIIEVKTSELKPHPRNEKIYGHREDVSDLVALIKERGRIVNNLVINADKVIISGHRRWLAAQELKYETVPCEILPPMSPEEELEELIHYNASRVKTLEQRIREGITLEEVYKVKNKASSLANLKQNKTDTDNVTISEEYIDDAPKGSTREEVAKEAGIPSGKTYERGKSVIIAVDKLIESGNEEDADLLLAILNKSVSAAADLAKEDVLSSLSDDDKHDLKIGKKSVRSVVPRLKDNGSGKRTKTQYAYVKKNIKIMDSVAKELKITGIAGYTDNQTQRIREDIGVIISNLQDLLHDDTVNT